MSKVHNNKDNRRIAFPQISKNFSAQVLTFATGFVLSFARLAFGISPFAAAFSASVQSGRCVAAMLGSCCGLLLDSDGIYTARLIATVICTGMINFFTAGVTATKERQIVALVSCGGCSVLTGVTVLAAQGFSADGAITYLLESIVGVGSVCFLRRLSFPGGFFIGREPLDMKQLSGITVFLSMIIMSADRLVLEGISLAHIAAAALILITAKLTGVSGGCISGGVMGFSVCMLRDASPVGIIYTFAGLACGAVSRFGRAAQCAAFAVISAVVMLVNSGEFDVISTVYEVIISLVIFAMIPKQFFNLNQKFFASGDTLPEFETMKKALVMEMESVSGGLKEVADTVDKIASGIQQLENRDSTDAADIETRQLVRDQFATLSTAVREIGARFAEETRFDTKTGARVHAVLTDYGITPRQIVCSNVGGREKIDISAERINGKISRTALTGDIEQVCGYRLSIPTVKQEENCTKITFEKKPRYNLRIGYAQSIAQGEMCGDSCDDFSDKCGNRIVVISDGMGTGPKAAIDGNVALRLFSKLVSSGLGFESALRLVNSAMIVKSDEESLATLDCVRINLNSGRAEFFKAGANVSFVCKGKRVYTVGHPSMPLGILREIEPDCCETALRRGDKVLMISDGVLPQAYREIAENLSRHNKNDPCGLAEEVVETAKKYSQSNHPDDITAAVIIVG